MIKRTDFVNPVILKFPMQVSRELDRASTGVIALYELDLNEDIKNRQLYWEDLAKEYPNYEDTIIRLGKDLARIPKGSFEGYFDAVDDEMSRKLLGDVLAIRLGKSIDDKEVQRSEIDSILDELGIERELVQSGLDIDPKFIIIKLLRGELLF